MNLARRTSAAAAVCAALVGCSTPEHTPDWRDGLYSTPPAYLRTTPEYEWRSIHSSDTTTTQPSASAITNVAELPSDLYRSVADQYFDAAMQAEQAGDSAHLVRRLQRSAELGNGQAHYELAKLFTQGKRVEQDANAAQRHLHAASGLGYVEADRVLGWQWIRGDIDGVDVAYGVQLLESAAQSSVRAQRELGMIYAGVYPLGISNLPTAIAYLEKAAAAGDVEAQFQLGKAYNRQGDSLQALTTLTAAAEAGHAEAAELINQLDAIGLDAGQPASAPANRSFGQDQPQRWFEQANAIMLRPQDQRSLHQEARAYALFALSAGAGHKLARKEMGYLQGIDTLMRRAEGDDWLTHYRESILDESISSRSE